jgi:neurotransmitter:Na+ symporter, NSS family
MLATAEHSALEAATARDGLNAVPKKRDRWASRGTFIIAGIGAVVGLGNIWRFPYLNYKHGGGTFLIPYCFFFVTTALPLFMCEMALGARRSIASLPHCVIGTARWARLDVV